MKPGLTFILFIILTKVSFSQTVDDFKELALNKEWKLDMYEEDGNKFPPAPEDKNDMMIFKPDYTVFSIESDRTDEGKWSYDESSKELIIVDSKTGQQTKLIVLKLTNEILTLEFKFPNGGSYIFYMKS